MIKIRKIVNKSDLMGSQKMHVTAVNQICHDFCRALTDHCSRHNSARISVVQSGKKPNTKLKQGELYRIEENENENIQLFEVLEYVFDKVATGVQETGRVTAPKVKGEILQNALKNTVKKVTEKIELMG